jgi:hypothetical protein
MFFCVDIGSSGSSSIGGVVSSQIRGAFYEQWILSYFQKPVFHKIDLLSPHYKVFYLFLGMYDLLIWHE